MAPANGDPRPRPRSLRRRILLGVVLGLVVYALLGLWADVGGMRAALSGFDLRLLPVAMGLSFTNYVVRFARWERYRGLLGIRMGRWTSFLIYLSGLALTVTPGKMGETFKSWLIREVDGTPVHRSAPIVVAERFTDLLSFLVLIGIGGLATQPEHAWVFWATLVLCAGLLALFASRRLADLACDVLARLPLVRRAAPKARAAFDSARVLMAPRELALPTLVSTVGWGLECVGFWLIASSFVQDGVPLLFAVYTFSFSAVAGAVAIVFPGGLGITEGAMSGLLGGRYEALGVAADAARARAASATILIRLCTLWFAMGVGLVALWLFRRQRAALAPARSHEGH